AITHLLGNFRSDGNPALIVGAALQLSAETTAYLPFHQALVGAITHLLGNFRSDGNPALIVGAALQLSAETTAYL
ncbi:hypothetical protein C2U36_27175, partial [Escherichia coli]